MGDFKKEKLRVMPAFIMEIMSCFFFDISRREAV